MSTRFLHKINSLFNRLGLNNGFLCNGFFPMGFFFATPLKAFNARLFFRALARSINAPLNSERLIIFPIVVSRRESFGFRFEKALVSDSAPSTKTSE